MSMETSASDPGGDRVATELKNFEDVVRYFQPSPGDVPALRGIDILRSQHSLQRGHRWRPHHLSRLQEALRPGSAYPGCSEVGAS